MEYFLIIPETIPFHTGNTIHTCGMSTPQFLRSTVLLCITLKF